MPENTSFYSLSHIAFATEFKHLYNLDALRTLNSFCNLERAILKIIYVAKTDELNKNQQDNKLQLDTYFKDVKHSTIYVDKNKSIEKDISKIVDDLEFNLLVMIKHSHDFLETITHEPVIKKMGYHTKKPLLIIPNELKKVVL